MPRRNGHRGGGQQASKGRTNLSKATRTPYRFRPPTQRCSVTGKKRYSSSLAAERALNQLAQKREDQKADSTETRYYECPACVGFHLTHLTQEEFDAIQARPAASDPR